MSKLFYNPFLPAFSSIGIPVPGAKVYFYYSGTNNLAPVFADSSQATPLSNPVTADLAARFPSIYLDESVIYRVRVTDSLGIPLGDDIDPYIPGTAGPQGIPGGNVMSVGPSSVISTSTISIGTNQLFTEDGSRWVYDGTMSTGDATTYPTFVKKTINNRFFRLDVSSGVTTWQAGMDPTGTVFCDTAWNALMAYLRRVTTPQTDNGPKCWVMPPIEFRRGTYKFQNTINLKDKVRLWASGNADPFGRLASVIFPAGVTGIVVNRHDTINESSTISGDTGTAARSVIQGLSIRCVEAVVSTSAEFVGSGIMIRAACDISDCEIDGFSYDGIAVVANTEGAFFRGEASETRITRCVISNNRFDGVDFAGIDVNVCEFTKNRVIQNGRYGIRNRDSGPLDTTLCHIASNGRKGDGKGIQSTSMVTNNGRLFGLRWDANPTTASQAGNGPPSSGDNQYWLDLNRADPNSNALAQAPQWVAGIALHNGGAFLFMALTGWTVMYLEGTQNGGYYNLYNRPSTYSNTIRFESTRVLGYQP